MQPHHCSRGFLRLLRPKFGSTEETMRRMLGAVMEAAKEAAMVNPQELVEGSSKWGGGRG